MTPLVKRLTRLPDFSVWVIPVDLKLLGVPRNGKHKTQSTKHPEPIL